MMTLNHIIRELMDNNLRNYSISELNPYDGDCMLYSIILYIKKDKKIKLVFNAEDGVFVDFEIT